MNVGKIHWGEFAKELFDKSGHELHELAAPLKIAKSTVYKTFERADWRYSEIEAASKVLGVNLLSYFINQSDPQSMVMEDMPYYQKEVKMKELELCRERLSAAEKLLAAKDEIIGLLKRRQKTEGEKG